MTDVLVLCYHAVSARWPTDLAVTPEALDDQLARLTRRGWRGATFADAVRSPRGQRTLAVTFDDAYRSVLELAAPILERHGIPGSVYAPTDWVGRPEPMTWPGIEEWIGTPFEDEQRCLGWDELAGLADAGWEVGSHTCSHPHLTALSDAELARELSDSRLEMERRLDRPCTTIAYPYGDVDGRVVRATAAAGYTAAGALPAAPHRAAPLAWPRVGVYPADATWRFELKASRVVRGARLLVAGARSAPG